MGPGCVKWSITKGIVSSHLTTYCHLVIVYVFLWMFTWNEILVLVGGVVYLPFG